LILVTELLPICCN